MAEPKEEKVPVEEQEVDRATLYEKYAEQNGTKEPEVPETPKETPPEQPPIEAEKEPETPPAEEKKEPEPSEEEKKREQEKADNLKKALDEERTKRKRLREEKDALEKRLRDLESKQEPPKEPEQILDYDAELNGMKSKIRSIELMEARREEQARQDAIRNQQQKLADMKKKTAKELADEGFPGFEYMAGAVTEYLVNLASQGEEEKEQALSLDNPEGWKKIIKEEIYPKFHKEYEESNRKRNLEDKKALKKEANLNTSHGKAPEKKTDDDNPDTWDKERQRKEYFKLRKEF